MLEVKDLVMHFRVAGDLPFVPRVVHAVDGISFDVDSGKTVGIVGESGSGKTTVARCVLALYRPTQGDVLLEGKSIFKSRQALRRLRRTVQAVFQDPAGALNPRFTVGRTIAEVLRFAGPKERRERRRMIPQLLEQVGLHESLAQKLPHQLSGGQQQRVSVARALATEPRILVLDEPTSALDVSLQAQIVNLLTDLRERLGLGYILITHELSIIRQLSEWLIVMYLGKPAEIGPTGAVITSPRHPYTRALIASVLVPDPARQWEPPALLGEIPSPTKPPSGCRFHTRCPSAKPLCGELEPQAQAFSGTQVWCHYPVDDCSTEASSPSIG